MALLLSDAPLRLPRIWLPLGLFLLLTLISLAFSGDMAWGLPQVRKMYVYSMLLVAFSLFRDMRIIRRLFLAWAVVGAIEAARGLVQFVAKVHEAQALGENFYSFYEPERITGFMSHWMTFGGEEMFALLMLTAYLFWSPSAHKRGLWVFLVCFAAMCAGAACRFHSEHLDCNGGWGSLPDLVLETMARGGRAGGVVGRILLWARVDSCAGAISSSTARKTSSAW